MLACMKLCARENPWRPEEDISSPEAGVTCVCERPCGWWAPNPVFLQEQSTFLITEPSLQT